MNGRIAPEVPKLIPRVSLNALWLLVAPLGFSAACADTPDRPPTTVRDSAGVAIIQSQAAAWGPGEGWFITPEPRLDLGAADGDGPTTFGQVADVTTVGSDWLVVAEAMASELRVFGTDGRFRSTIGRPGQGPGEFRYLASVRAVGGDTLVVFDRALRRLSRLLLTGEVLSTLDLGSVTQGTGGELAFLDDVAPLGADALVGREGRDFSGTTGQLGVTRDTVDFMIMDPDGSGVRLVDRVPGASTVRREVDGRGMYLIQPFTVLPSWTVKGDTLYVAPGDQAEIRVVGRQGLHRILRRAATPAVLEERHWTAWLDGMVRSIPEADRGEARGLMDPMELPERLPFYRNLLVDPVGYLWAERFESPGLGPGREWDVFDPDGRYLGPVETPHRLAVLEVGLDQVLGVWADEFDVPRVRIHTLIRGGSGR